MGTIGSCDAVSILMLVVSIVASGKARQEEASTITEQNNIPKGSRFGCCLKIEQGRIMFRYLREAESVEHTEAELVVYTEPALVPA